MTIRFNENNEVIEEMTYRAVLAGLELGEDISYSMQELEGLAEAAGVTVAGQLIQKLERPNKATFFGKGKVFELCEFVESTGADMVIFNDELSGIQLRNLEDACGVRVIDRTILILDIFASRAVSREGSLQIELAMLSYRLPRLTGFGKSLSRQAGGIGTRGPGEKKLETDRRHIQKRMDDIRAELKKASSVRATQRTRREKNSVPVVALVGYTNSGKSALMNRMLDDVQRAEKSVFEKDMLFATLDTSHRKIDLDSSHSFILIDTVGFVSRLPHTLVEAFKSTLEEVADADLLLHVVDSSYDGYSFHMEVTDRVLKEIGAGDKEKIVVYNKKDIAPEEPIGGDFEHFFISAKTGEGTDCLIERIREKIFAGRIRARLVIPYSRGDIVSYLCEKADVISMEYSEEGTVLDAELTEEDYGRYGSYAAL
ncbi:MAG: GTPase HflX [Clostridiales bacterium]|nr:GTPase HflX [Clostridiales bacterium]MDD6390071.1 GTPase HflX [Bacillota bacterium]MDY5975768.1 GTPase HflX [Anaerovoracaceae bacterium]